ncbi:hypothetical protein BCV70DRAFT_215234 [Testicularia cyperi]|uniref:Glycosyltransferase family 34 protein n=1 Tax=Testicularia cyperi TaxID=1882483 RepID=A0A317XTV7_9BASI|nr:hypothetical protein BCV70DRAFT_215234 [Testicularia cyperi]
MSEAEAFLLKPWTSDSLPDPYLPRWRRGFQSNKARALALRSWFKAAVLVIAVIAVTLLWSDQLQRFEEIRKQHELATALITGGHAFMPYGVNVSGLTIPAAHGSKRIRRIAKVMARFGIGAIKYNDKYFVGNYTLQGRLLQTHIEYAHRWGYPLLLTRSEIFNGASTKLVAMLTIIAQELAKPASERLEWLMWSDVDTLIMNPSIELEHFLPPSPRFDHINFLVASDYNTFNSGILMIRVSEWAIEYISNSLAYSSYHHAPDVDYQPYEQDSMIAVLNATGSKFLPAYAEVPRSVFNIYPETYEKGDFCVHFAGERKDKFAQWLGFSDSHEPARELPWNQTRASRQLSSFWDRLEKQPGKHSVLGKNS